MEVLVGPAFTIDVPADGNSEDRIFLNGSPENDRSNFRISGPPKFFAGGESESSSSIGTPDDSDNEEEEVQSKLKIRTGLGSLDAMEDSLPIKRGLSSHFDGKSKSFSDLSQVSTLKDLKELQKQESPFNKRRRVLIASKWSRRSSFYSWSNPQSMPLLPVDEDRDDDDDDEDEEEEEEKARKVPSASSSSSSSLAEEKKPEDQVQLRLNRVPESYAAHMRLRLGSFKARSFSLADLQEHDDEEEDED
ncbi:nucleolin-like [Vigna unguiculata]|uniref:nucleolin-like n=1 Tax=Vigna unguiculata TaxID=3917 RepID=UPI001016FBBC|nr:nucleolin-like [Vigna unguiculata]